MTSMSGIKVDPTVGQFFSQDMNLKKLHKFAAFKLSDDQKKVVIDDTLKGQKANTKDRDQDKEHFNALKEQLKMDEPRFILYDFGFKGANGRDVSKLVFLYWCCTDCPVRKRMIYTSTKDDVKKCFSGIGIEFQVNDLEDMDYDRMADEIVKRGF